jgi:hypothetical protein
MMIVQLLRPIGVGYGRPFERGFTPNRRIGGSQDERGFVGGPLSATPWLGRKRASIIRDLDQSLGLRQGQAGPAASGHHER